MCIALFEMPLQYSVSRTIYIKVNSISEHCVQHLLTVLSKVKGENACARCGNFFSVHLLMCSFVLVQFSVSHLAWFSIVVSSCNWSASDNSRQKCHRFRPSGKHYFKANKIQLCSIKLIGSSGYFYEVFFCIEFGAALRFVRVNKNCRFDNIVQI